MHHRYDSWKSEIKQRRYLEQFAQKFGISKPQDWGKVVKDDLIKFGGTGLVKRYGNSIRGILTNVYQEIEWKPEWFSTNRGYFQDKVNQRIFLENLAKKLNIKSPKDWVKIDIKVISEHGGAGLASHYKCSLRNMLQGVFDETKWNDEWFTDRTVTKNYWSKKENQRKYMKGLEAKFGIQEAKDWGLISCNRILNESGAVILNKYGSPYKALQNIFPEIEWKKEWFTNVRNFPPGYWSRENQRKFLEDYKRILGVQRNSDWGKVTTKRIIDIGGSALISKHGSVFKLLQYAYPEIVWKKQWFPCRHPTGFFDSEQNQRNFFLELAQKHGLTHTSDWKRISLVLLKQKGGQFLMSHYNGSILKALNTLFPKEDWTFLTPVNQRQRVSSAHQVLKYNLKDIFPLHDFATNFRGKLELQKF